MIIAIAWPISILLTAFGMWLITDSAAHQRGYKSGYETGSADGRKAGYLNGELVGRKFGEASGYERGRKDGIESEKALQALHRQTVAKPSTPAAQAEKPAKASKPAQTPKRGNGARAPKR